MERMLVNRSNLKILPSSGVSTLGEIVEYLRGKGFSEQDINNSRLEVKLSELYVISSSLETDDEFRGRLEERKDELETELLDTLTEASLLKRELEDIDELLDI